MSYVQRAPDVEPPSEFVASFERTSTAVFDYLCRCLTLAPYNHYAHLGLEPVANRTCEDADESKSANSAGIKRSWSRSDTRAERVVRHAVSVMNLDGVEREYASVRAAFEALHLPLAKHVRFRLALKDAGALSFEHRNEVYAFRLVARR